MKTILLSMATATLFTGMSACGPGNSENNTSNTDTMSTATMPDTTMTAPPPDTGMNRDTMNTNGNNMRTDTMRR